MDENILKFRVGIFVVIAMVILAILIFVNSEGWTRQYTVFVKPKSAPGVTEGTPIRKNGILIGRVKNVKSVEDPANSQKDHVLLELAINQDEIIYENDICSIGAESLLGDSVVEIVRGTQNERGRPVRADHTMVSYSLKRNPLEFVDLVADLQPEISETFTAIQSSSATIQEAGKSVKDLSDTIKKAFDEDSDLKKLLKSYDDLAQKAGSSLDNFDRMFENVRSVVDDPEFKAQVKKSINEFPKIIVEIREAATKAREAIDKFGKIPDGFNANLDNIEEFTAALKERGPEILKQTDQSLKNIDKFVEEVRVFTKSFSNFSENKGTLSKLLNDPEMYNLALDTVKRLRDSATKIEPLLNDLRMFGDAIARDPGVLGVRDALDGRPGKTGAKGTAGRDGGLFRPLR